MSAMKVMQSGPRLKQRGAVMVLVVLALVMILGFAALALDTYQLFVVRNELQNDADAAVLAGAGHFYAPGSGEPDFDTAEARAAAAVPLNPTLLGSLSTAQVTSGYWSTENGFQPLPMEPEAGDYPALRVTVSRNNTSNGGNVEMFLGTFIGHESVPVSATATAMVVPPGAVYPGGLFPVAITSCLFDEYWNEDTNEPEPDPATGAPRIFRIGSAYHYEGCLSGQWTSFKTNKNDVPTIRDLIENGNPEKLAIGDPTYIQPGVENALFKTVHDCSAAGDRSCEYVTMPVIIYDELNPHETEPIKAFACLRILDAVGGSEKYVRVQMTMGCKIDGSGVGPGGPFYGATLPPKLVQ